MTCQINALILEKEKTQSLQQSKTEVEWKLVLINELKSLKEVAREERSSGV